MPGRNGFAMHTLFDIFGGLLVARAARLGQMRKMQRRIRRSRWQNRVTIVAITARGRTALALSQG